jgi:hypothetical protein
VDIGILTCNRPEKLLSLLQSLKYYGLVSDSSVTILDNASNDISQHENLKISGLFKASYTYIEKNIAQDRRARIQEGKRALYIELLHKDAPNFMVLEDDWIQKVAFDAESIGRFLLDNQSIGQVRLREAIYDDSPEGMATINFVTCEDVVLHPAEFNNDISIGNLHWTNNPSIVNRCVTECFAHSSTATEFEFMILFQKNYPINAQVIPGVFEHTGLVRSYRSGGRERHIENIKKLRAKLHV